MAYIGQFLNVYTVAGFGILLAVLNRVDIFGTSSLWLYLGVALVGFILGFAIVVCSGKTRKLPISPHPPPSFHTLVTKIMEVRARRKRKGRRVVISRNIDNSIKEVFDLVLRDYIMFWYESLGKDKDVFAEALEDDMWELIHNLALRLKRIDMVRFLSSDVVYKLCDHFQKLRETSVREGEEPKIFYLHPSLSSEEGETEFLREAVEVLLVLLLPEKIAGCETARHLLREIITCQVVKPAVEMLCSPHFINSTFLMHLEHRVMLVEKSKRRYAYAATYEDFIKHINSCNTVEDLLQIRYHILTEIMHATVIENLKKSRGMQEAEKERLKGNTKGDLLIGRNLKRYINQCNVAKAQCEKRLRLLGGPDYQSYYKGGTSSQDTSHQTQRLMSIDEILQDGKKRSYFLSFLKREGKEDLLNFWQLVESLKSSKKPGDQHMSATTIYQTFVATSSVVKVDKQLVRGMQAFLVGNAGPDAFYQAQHKVYQTLDQDHFPSFLVSEFYASLSEEFAPKSELEDGNMTDELQSSYKEDTSSQSFETSESAEQANTVEGTLQRVEERLNNKIQALSNLKSSHGSDSKMEQLLEKEIENLKLEKRRLELYIEQTNLWTEHIDKWRTDVCLPETEGSGDKTEIYYVIVVHPIDPRVPVSGWVVSRRLAEFHSLQARLKECSKWLSKVKLPQLNKKLFGKEKLSEFLKRSKVELQKYLTAMLQDDTLRHSEALYSFLVPKPRILQDITQQEVKKGGFSLAGIFKNAPPEGDRSNLPAEAESEEESVQDRKDSIAEPLYSLISEVFELHGMFRWLRRTLIVFVQATFGGTINKQLRETVDWLASEPMILFYIGYFREAMWPNGKLADALPTPSLEEQKATQQQAREKFLQNLPDFLQNLLGKRNSRLGAVKVFEALQDVRTNKHIFYNLLELALLEVCPELKDPRLLEQLELEERRQEEMRNQDTGDERDGKETSFKEIGQEEDTVGSGIGEGSSVKFDAARASIRFDAVGTERPLIEGENSDSGSVMRQRRKVEGKEKSDGEEEKEEEEVSK